MNGRKRKHHHHWQLPQRFKKEKKQTHMSFSLRRIWLVVAAAWERTRSWECLGAWDLDGWFPARINAWILMDSFQCITNCYGFLWLFWILWWAVAGGIVMFLACIALTSGGHNSLTHTPRHSHPYTHTPTRNAKLNIYLWAGVLIYRFQADLLVGLCSLFCGNYT